MKNLCCLLLLIVFACKQQPAVESRTEVQDTVALDHTEVMEPDTVVGPVYGNQRFRNVIVNRLDSLNFQIKGQAQVFEGSFGWVLEDGHDELQTGHQMTDAGAPEWGNFDFKVMAQKNEANTTLHLVLFEVSAKDGSRQYELPLKLY